MAARTRDYRDYQRDDESQRECARGQWCDASTRDTEGAWHPALAYQAFCPACTRRIITSATEIPPLFGMLAARIGDPPRRGGTGGGRRPPGPRLLVSPAIDAWLREVAAVSRGWAARVRAVPGLQLTRSRHAPGQPLRVRDDCKVLAVKEGSPLLALAEGPMTRLYDLPEGARPGDGLDRASARCRNCGQVITRSPVSGWWWAPASPSRASEFCDHAPAPGTFRSVAPEGPVPDSLLADIGDEEIVAAGDGWVKVTRSRDGSHAGADLLDLHWRGRRLSGQVPARPEPLDGVPCRNCEAMSLVRADPPSDPHALEDWSRCVECGDRMSLEEYREWTRWYDAWARGAALPSCRRCELRDHEHCYWDRCECKLAGHAAALFDTSVNARNTDIGCYSHAPAHLARGASRFPGAGGHAPLPRRWLPDYPGGRPARRPQARHHPPVALPRLARNPGPR